ncbi:MAG: oligosaccharide flippase family protein, partial [Dehalococcoidia bacterium]|nr:oligosaccharide flippase family protein [Dehalococcoidia bacterium]
LRSRRAVCQNGRVTTSDSSTASEQPLAYRAVRGGVWVALSSYWGIAVGFAATILMARILGPEVFGLLALASFFSLVLSVRQKLGVAQAFIQSPDSGPSTMGALIALETMSGVATVLIALIAGPVLTALGYPADVGWLVLAMAGVELLGAALSAPVALFEKDLRFGPSSAVMAAATTLSYIPAVVGALTGWGYWAIVAQMAGYQVFAGVGFAALIWRTGARRQLWPIRLDAGVIRRMLSFSASVGLANIATTIFVQFDNFLIGTFVGATTLGLYDRAYRTAQWPDTLLFALINRTGFATYARVRADPERLARTVAMVTWALTVAAPAIGLALVVAAPDLVLLLYGEAWIASGVFLRVLAAYSMIRPLTNNALAVVTATGDPRATALVGAAQATLLAVFGLPATIVWGATGTLAVVGVGYGLGLLASHWRACRAVAMDLVDLYWAPAVATLLVVSGYWLVNTVTGLVELPLLLRVVAKVVGGGGGYVALLLLLRPRASRQRFRYILALARGVPS